MGDDKQAQQPPKSTIPSKPEPPKTRLIKEDAQPPSLPKKSMEKK